MAGKKKAVETEKEISTEVKTSASHPRLICTVEDKQFVEKGIIIRSDGPVEIPLPYSSNLQSRIRAGYIKEVN